MIGQRVDVCGYEYTIHSLAARQPEGKHACRRWIAFRRDDRQELVWAIIQRRTISKIRRWAVIEQTKGVS